MFFFFHFILRKRSTNLFYKQTTRRDNHIITIPHRHKKAAVFEFSKLESSEAFACLAARLMRWVDWWRDGPEFNLKESCSIFASQLRFSQLLNVFFCREFCWSVRSPLLVLIKTLSKYFAQKFVFSKNNFRELKTCSSLANQPITTISCKLNMFTNESYPVKLYNFFIIQRKSNQNSPIIESWKLLHAFNQLTMKEKPEMEPLTDGLYNVVAFTGRWW